MHMAITDNNERVYAFDIDTARLKRLSNKNRLKCPECNKIVKFKEGGKKSPHFFHLPNNNCKGNGMNIKELIEAGNENSKATGKFCDKCKGEYTINYAKGVGYLKICLCSGMKVIQQPLCPTCKGKMFLRKNFKTNKLFWGCVNFPRCKGSLEFND